jgi:hypothetical protein
MAAVCMRREMAAEVKGALWFGLSLLLVARGVIWALAVHIALPKIAACTYGPQRLDQLF